MNAAGEIGVVGGLITATPLVPIGTPLVVATSTVAMFPATQSAYADTCLARAGCRSERWRCSAERFGTAAAMYAAGRSRSRAGAEGPLGPGQPGAPSGAGPRGKIPFSLTTIDGLLKRMEGSDRWNERHAALSLFTTVLLCQTLDRRREDRALDVMWQFACRPFGSEESNRSFHRNICLAYLALLGRHLVQPDRRGEIIRDLERRFATQHTPFTQFVFALLNIGYRSRSGSLEELAPPDLLPTRAEYSITMRRNRASRREAIDSIKLELTGDPDSDKLMMGLTEWMRNEYLLQILLADPDDRNRRAAANIYEVLGYRLWDIIGIPDIPNYRSAMRGRTVANLMEVGTLAMALGLRPIAQECDRAYDALRQGYERGSREFYTATREGPGK